MDYENGNREHYDIDYARKYYERTLTSPYTIYKNELLARTANEIGVDTVLDLGCNISPIINQEVLKNEIYPQPLFHFSRQKNEIQLLECCVKSVSGR